MTEEHPDLHEGDKAGQWRDEDDAQFRDGKEGGNRTEIERRGGVRTDRTTKSR